MLKYIKDITKVTDSIAHMVDNIKELQQDQIKTTSSISKIVRRIVRLEDKMEAEKLRLKIEIMQEIRQEFMSSQSDLHKQVSKNQEKIGELRGALNSVNAISHTIIDGTPQKKIRSND